LQRVDSSLVSGEIEIKRLMFERFFRTHNSSRELETRQIRIRGMRDKNCERTIKKALLTKSGVKEVYIDRDEEIAKVTYDPARVDVPSLHQAILRKGYFPKPVDG
jgi:copper chaperone CopZ